MTETVLLSISLNDLSALIREAIKLELSQLPSKEATHGSNELLTRAQVAARLHVTKKTLNEWTKTGRLKAHRIGRRVLFRAGDVDNALNPIRVK